MKKITVFATIAFLCAFTSRAVPTYAEEQGLAVDGMTTHATGAAERDAAKALLAKRTKKGRRITLGADNNYTHRKLRVGMGTNPSAESAGFALRELSQTQVKNPNSWRAKGI